MNKNISQIKQSHNIKQGQTIYLKRLDRILEAIKRGCDNFENCPICQADYSVQWNVKILLLSIVCNKFSGKYCCMGINQRNRWVVLCFSVVLLGQGISGSLIDMINLC